MEHYTDKAGANGIGSARVWLFRAAQPPGAHPFGAYFTTLAPTTPHLSKRLRIPRAKVAHHFEFSGCAGLEPLQGGRGAYIFYSRADYPVTEDRQLAFGETGL